MDWLENESILELIEIFTDWTIIPVVLIFFVLSALGTGLLESKHRKTALFVGVALAVAMFYFGIDRHEWGEVMFNGQLL